MYLNREDAGKQLAELLRSYAPEDAVVLALPRGGIVLAAEVARELRAPLGVVLVRKIGHPLYEEYAIGAVVEGESPLYDEDTAQTINPEWLRENEVAARHLLQHRHNLYYGDDFRQPSIEGKTAILVDDGIATGLTMQAAVESARHGGAKQVVVAAPVASDESVEVLRHIADEIVILDDPHNFLGSVGSHYIEFDQVEDEEVRALLREANRDVHAAITSHA